MKILKYKQLKLFIFLLIFLISIIFLPIINLSLKKTNNKSFISDLIKKKVLINDSNIIQKKKFKNELIIDINNKYFNYFDKEKKDLYFNSNDEVFNNLKKIYDSIKNTETILLNQLFGWFEAFQNIFDKLQININEDIPNSTKSIFTSIFILLKTLSYQFTDFDLINKNIIFDNYDIEFLKTKPGTYLCEPLNEIFDNIIFLINEKEEEKFLLNLQIKGKIKFDKIIEFIHRLIKYLIFFVNKNPPINRNIDFKNIKSFFINFYYDNQNKMKEVFFDFFSEIIMNIKLKILINEIEKDKKTFDTLKSEKLINWIYKNKDFLLNQIGLYFNLNWILQGVLNTFFNFFTIDKEKIKSVLEKILKNFKPEKFFYTIKDIFFVTQIARVLSSKRSFTINELEESYGSEYVESFYWIKRLYDNFIEYIDKWLDSNIIDEQKIKFITKIISILNIEEFFNQKKRTNEFQWNKFTKTSEFDIKRYATNFDAEIKKYLIIKFIDKKINQKYSIILKKIKEKEYQLIYFASNHFDDDINRFLEQN